MRAAEKLAGAAFALCLLPVAQAGDRKPTQPSVVDSQRAKAIATGLRYLVRQQARDGSFGPKSGIVGISSLSLLALMAQGRSNGAIAEELFVGTKTVETHIRSILQKLDIEETPEGNRRVQAVLEWMRS